MRSFLQVDGPYGPRFDGPIGPRVLRFDTACGCEGVVSPAAMSIICRSAASVTGFTFVSLLLHDEVPEPPSIGRGVAPSGDGG